MITFKLSFILAFSLKIVESSKKTPKKEKKGKKGKDKKGKDKKGKVKKEKAPSAPQEKPKHLFEVDKPTGAAHIDYELVPSKSKYQIDVICWGSVAKIFTNDGQRILKTFVKDDKVWVPVCLKHYAENFNIEDLKKYQKYVVKFNITSNMKKISKMAKTDKSKKFYSYINEAESTDFVELYNDDPNLEQRTSEQRRKESLERVMKDIIIECANYPTQDLVSWLHYPTKYDIFHDIIQKQCSGREVDCKDFVLPCPLPVELCKPVKVKIKPDKKKSGKGKKDKKSKGSSKGKKGKKEKKKVNDTVTLLVPAEVFFTDPLMAIYKAENDGVITNVFLLISVDRLLTRAQKLFLNPLVIKIKKLSKIPVDILNEKGIGSIYLSYQIPWIANCQSIEKPIREKIRFNESHIFFNDLVPKIKLMEFVQTQKLFVEIYGIKNIPPPKISASLFGNEKGDEVFCHLQTKNMKTYEVTYDPVVLLAVCSFDISSLLKNVWDFQEKGQCHSPNVTLCQKLYGSYGDVIYSDLENVPEININRDYFKYKGAIPEDILLSFGTTLKAEVYIMAPQAASLMLNQFPNTFKRIFMILYDETFVRHVLNDIIIHNEGILNKIGHNFDKQTMEFIDIITGFMIDNGTSFAIFLEGLTTGFILNVWHLIEKYEIQTGKIFFNTDSAFEKRLYYNFLNEGLYIITLKIPLSDILADQRIYLQGNVPAPCIKALTKLCLLCHSFLFRSILQYGLLPRPVELLSLNIEWGVPERWKPDRRKSVISNRFSFLNID